ncbi:MAG: hypothetical protein M1114_06870 [Candidatus Dependentiae bacterium]|nr:hypothetical protein [Candidatus Dependentiae bacterium]
MLSVIADFFLSEWLWSITWGLYHIPVNIFIMFLLTKLTVHYSTRATLLLSLLANIFGLIAFTILVGSIIVFVIGLNYLPAESAYSGDYSSFAASLFLGIVYALLQSLFFYLVSKQYTIQVWHMISIALLSNVMAAQFVYLLLKN